jgi:hypothetical protein
LGQAREEAQRKYVGHLVLQTIKNLAALAVILCPLILELQQFASP